MYIPIQIQTNHAQKKINRNIININLFHTSEINQYIHIFLNNSNN